MFAQKRRFAALAAASAVLLLAACGGSGGDASSGSSSAKAAVSLANAWGAAEIPADPKRVAVVSGGDRSIAYALGIVPVIEADYPASTSAPYTVEARKGLGITEPKLYNATDGTDFAAVAAAEPDVILGMQSYSMDEDYAQLAKIAPVITFSEKSQINDMTWQDRILRAGEGLGIKDKAQAVIDANKKAATDAAAANPDFKGKTYTYLIMHPEQITYASDGSAAPSPVDDLGLVKPANAAKFSSAKSAVSLENLDLVDADVVLIAYPFGDEGLMTQKELESNPLWQKIPAVAKGHWAILDSESGLASDLAYPDALSYPWVIEQVTPAIVKALAGKGGGSSS